MVGFLTFEQLHGRRGTGSTNIRVHQLIKYWEEAELYRFGSKPNVLVFQKVYWTPDYYLTESYKGGLKILDICDPDWLDNAYVKRTVDAMDAVVVPTEALQHFIQQMTDKPVRVIPDRFDIDLIPERKKHKGKCKRAIWFGYAHNAELLKSAVPALENLGIALTIISDDDPMVWRYAKDSEKFRASYKYNKYDEETIYTRLQQCDIAILPEGNRPKDIFKSNNKTTKAQLAGLPVAKNIDDLELYLSDIEREKASEYNHKQAIAEYDCKLSIKEYEALIDELQRRD